MDAWKKLDSFRKKNKHHVSACFSILIFCECIQCIQHHIQNSAIFNYFGFPTWRIIPCIKWLINFITMESKSPNWGRFPFQMPEKPAYKLGVWSFLLTNWEPILQVAFPSFLASPPSRLPTRTGRQGKIGCRVARLHLFVKSVKVVLPGLTTFVGDD